MFVFSKGTVLDLMARRNSSILEAPFGPFPTLICFHEATGMHLLNQHTLPSMSASVSSFRVRFLLTSRHRAVRVAPALHHDALHDLLRSLLPCLVTATGDATGRGKEVLRTRPFLRTSLQTALPVVLETVLRMEIDSR